MSAKPRTKKRARPATNSIETLPLDEPLVQLIRAPHISKMETLSACRRVLRNILRAMARGDIPATLGARLAYVANMVAGVVKQEQEIKELTVLREQLQQLQGTTPMSEFASLAAFNAHELCSIPHNQGPDPCTEPTE